MIGFRTLKPSRHCLCLQASQRPSKRGVFVATHSAATNPPLVKFAIPLLGILGGVQGIDPNIAATALPEASKALGMEGSLQALAASIMTLALAASVVTTGLLADRIGRRKVLMAALVISIVGDLIVAVAPQSGMYLAGRAIAGVGLGAVYGAAFAFIRAVAKPGHLPKAIGQFTAVVMLFTVIFTFAGGALASIDWRLAYIVVPATALLSLLVIPFVLPHEPVVATGNPDIAGQAALIVAIVGVLYGINNISMGVTDPMFFVPLVVGIAAAALFMIHEHRSPHAFFPVTVFKSPIFLAAVMAGLVYNVGNGVAFLQMSNLWHYATRIDSFDVSLWQIPFLLAGVAAGLGVGQLMSRGMTNRLALFLGTAITVVGFVSMAAVSSAESFWVFALPISIIGFGIVVAAIPFGNLIMQSAPPQYFGPITSARTTIGQIWYTIGVAISTVMINRITTGGVTDRLKEAGVSPTQMGTALDHVRVYASETHSDPSKKGAEALAGVRDSYLAGYDVTMLVFAAIIGFGGLLGVALLTKNHGDPHPAGGASSAAHLTMAPSGPEGNTAPPPPAATSTSAAEVATGTGPVTGSPPDSGAGQQTAGPPDN